MMLCKRIKNISDQYWIGRDSHHCKNFLLFLVKPHLGAFGGGSGRHVQRIITTADRGSGGECSGRADEEGGDGKLHLGIGRRVDVREGGERSKNMTHAWELRLDTTGFCVHTSGGVCWHNRRFVNHFTFI